ncbi:Os06g0720800 [Oryza sativa Japonica Group]|uniref:Os06g0720800 protein n=1 Tax=Oryza sativa subsp. japonica TaxID=39947 RepID=A0A0P0X156_ORYSJ|nr:Os06g0720800 [Oryza sativa Japonica Group]
MAAAAAENAASGSVRGYTSAGKNATTASSRTSTGHPIEVHSGTSRRRPPALSHFSVVHCPDRPELDMPGGVRGGSGEGQLREPYVPPDHQPRPSCSEAQRAPSAGSISGAGILVCDVLDEMSPKKLRDMSPRSGQA